MEHEPIGGRVVVCDNLYNTSANGDTRGFFLIVTVGCDRYRLDESFVVP